MIELLKSKWPLLFERTDQPLAIGTAEAIRTALALDDEAFRALQKAFGKHVNRPSYLRALANGRSRMDITGQRHPVAPGHVSVAQKMLADKLAAKARKKAAKAESEANSVPATQPTVKTAPVVIIKKRRVIAGIDA